MTADKDIAPKHYIAPTQKLLNSHEKIKKYTSAVYTNKPDKSVGHFLQTTAILRTCAHPPLPITFVRRCNLSDRF
ncbi:hypothetical protein EMIT0194MI4_50333 [Pseudomonas sp. IT-194MI4]